jgi:hypothetical protein
MGKAGGQHRRIRRAPSRIAGERQRAEGIAVVALPSRDEMHAVRFADLEIVLPCQLQGRFGRFRAARNEAGRSQPAGGMANQNVRQFLGRLRGEEAVVRIGQRFGLLPDRVHHTRVAMPQAGYRRAARCVDVLPAGMVGDDHAFGGHRLRQGCTGQAPVKNVAGQREVSVSR